MKDICYLDEVLSGFLGDHMLWQGHERPLSAMTVSVGLFTWIRVLFITRFHAMNFLMSLGL